MLIQKTIERFQNAVVQIAARTGNGTGFYLPAYDLIVTNYHVVRDLRQSRTRGRLPGRRDTGG